MENWEITYPDEGQQVIEDASANCNINKEDDKQLQVKD